MDGLRKFRAVFQAMENLERILVVSFQLLPLVLGGVKDEGEGKDTKVKQKEEEEMFN